MLSWRSLLAPGLSAVLLCALPTRRAHAQEAWSLLPASRLWIDGTSNVQPFSCEAPRMTLTVAAGSVPGVPTPAGTSRVPTAVVTVPVAGMDCGNPFMNIHMRRALKSGAFPTIQFAVAASDISAGSGVPTQLTGVLSLGGITRPVVLLASSARLPDGLHVTGRAHVSMSDFGLTPPSLFFHRVRVADPVVVCFELWLRREVPTPPAM
jgi:polyisoprenoid-binding protein YceI